VFRRRAILPIHIQIVIVIKKMKKNRKGKIFYSTQKGFSILEVMMALFVLVVGIGGTISLTGISIINSRRSLDSIVASQLSQEGIELTRNIRDNNLANKEESFSGSFPDLDAATCVIDVSTLSLDCSGVISEKLYLNSEYVFVSDSGMPTETKFYRRIFIKKIGAASEDRDITSMVYWGTALNNDEIIQKCTLQNRCVYSKVQLTD